MCSIFYSVRKVPATFISPSYYLAVARESATLFMRIKTTFNPLICITRAETTVCENCRNLLFSRYRNFTNDFPCFRPAHTCFGRVSQLNLKVKVYDFDRCWNLKIPDRL